MKIAVTLFLLSGFTMLLPACTHSVTPIAPTKQPDDAKLVFPSLEIDQTNRGTININGYDRHFSVTFPTSYNREEAYPVVLFFHGCMCRPNITDETILSYLDWSPRLEPYKADFIIIRMSAYSEKKPAVRVDDGAARGMWLWHEGFESERDDFASRTSSERAHSFVVVGGIDNRPASSAPAATPPDRTRTRP